MFRKSKHITIVLIAVLVFVFLTSFVFVAAKKKATGKKKLVYGYISPGPDTWYKRDVEGFQVGAEKYGVDVIVLNSDYSVEKEIANIDAMITQGVDGLSMFSFNENGARIAAQKCNKAKIPIVVTDSAGSILREKVEVVAAVDFDWIATGQLTAQWMAKNYPGENYVIITGNFTSVPMIDLHKGMKEESEKLGKNKLLDIREAKFDPNLAVDVAQDLIQSGLDFSLIYVADEDMGAAVIRMLTDKGVINKPYKVLSENGSPAGIPPLKDGRLKFTVSMSPGWEGLLAFLALHRHVVGASSKVNQAIMMPIVGITKDNIDQIAPWEYDPVWWDFTKKYHPDLLKF